MNLTEAAYLIAWDSKRSRMRGSQHAAMVAAALLIELQGQNLIKDDGKHPATTGSRSAEGPGRSDVLTRIAGERPRSWRHWVSKTAKPVRDAVRDQLAKDRVISLEERTLLGFRLPPKVTVRDSRAVGELVRRARSAALGSGSTTHVSADDAALAALAAAAELSHVLTMRDRWANRKRLKELTAQAGPAARAFKKHVEYQQTSAAV